MTERLTGMVLLLLFLAAAGMAVAADAKSPYVVGAIVSASGPNAPLGVPQRDTLLMVETSINKKGGINGHPLKVVIEDDASDTTKAVKAAKKLIEQDQVCALIGGTGTATSLAVAPIVGNAEIAQVSLAAGAALTDPRTKKWVFRVVPKDAVIVAKLLDYLEYRGISRFAVLYDSGAFGCGGRDQLRLLAPKYRMKIVTEESFASTDTDMTVQLTRIRTNGAQAILCWGTHPGPACVVRSARQMRIPIPLFLSSGSVHQAFLDLAGAAANGVTFPAGKLIVAEQLPASDPEKKLCLAFAKQFQDRYARSADQYGGHAWDALNIVVLALSKAGDNRAKLRDEIEKTTNFTGITGIFTYEPDDHDGLNEPVRDGGSPEG